jgi:hypothetical protein
MLLAADVASYGPGLTSEVFQRLGINANASRYLALPGRTPDGQNGHHGDFPMDQSGHSAHYGTTTKQPGAFHYHALVLRFWKACGDGDEGAAQQCGGRKAVKGRETLGIVAARTTAQIIRPRTGTLARGSRYRLGKAQVRGSGIAKHAEQLHHNSDQVREAERCLAIQHTFIERLRALSRDSSSAEALEVMREILRGLYHSHMLLRRKVVNRRARTDSSTVKKATVGVRAVASAAKLQPR